MALFRSVLFALFAASLLHFNEAGFLTAPADEATEPAEPAAATDAQETSSKSESPQRNPLQLVEGGKDDGEESPDLNTVFGEVDEQRQQDEAEAGTPIDEDFIKPQVANSSAKATAPQAEEQEVHVEPLREGFEKADASKHKDSGIYNPMTGQVESLLQVGSKSHDVDDVEDTEDMDEDDAALVNDEADTSILEESDEDAQDQDDTEESDEAQDLEAESDDSEDSNAEEEEEFVGTDHEEGFVEEENEDAEDDQEVEDAEQELVDNAAQEQIEDEDAEA